MVFARTRNITARTPARLLPFSLESVGSARVSARVSLTGDNRPRTAPDTRGKTNRARTIRTALVSGRQSFFAYRQARRPSNSEKTFDLDRIDFLQRFQSLSNVKGETYSDSTVVSEKSKF